MHSIPPPTFPMALGEEGRGRNIAHIHQAPRLRDGEVLLAVFTNRAYTRFRRSGTVERYGPCRLIAEGRWAHGAAGNTAGGPDMLLAVQPGAAVFSRGGDGVGHWAWVRPNKDIVTMSKVWVDAHPQEALPLLRELTALPCLPPDKGWRQKLAEIEEVWG